MQVSDIKLDTSFSLWNLKSLRKELSCFKIPNNSSCIYFFLTNIIRSFQETQVFETWISDFDKLVVMVIKSTFPKLPPKIIIFITR